jgi:hypothetical protein
MKNFTRRSFAKIMLGSVALGTFISTTAFSCPGGGSVFSNILTYTSIGLQAFSGVLTLLGPIIPMGGMIVTIIALVKAGFGDLQLVVNDYNNAPAADKTTLLGKISTVMEEIISHLTNFWNNLTIPDGNLASVAEGLLGLIVGMLQGFQTQLPPPVVTPVVAAARALPRKIAATPMRLTMPQFKTKFNGILTNAGKPPVKFR